MKTIEPVTVWFNGEEQQVTVLSAISNGDNLTNSASFSYQLLKQVENSPMYGGIFPLVVGQLTMSGEAYQAWETNDYAYDWIAQQLNLTITGPYVPPVPPQPEPTPEPTPEPVIEE